jgi:RES domain-containing protein
MFLWREGSQRASDTKAYIEVSAGNGSKRAGGRSNACGATVPPCAADNMALAVVGCPCLPKRNSGQTVEIAILDPLPDITVHIE